MRTNQPQQGSRPYLCAVKGVLLRKPGSERSLWYESRDEHDHSGTEIRFTAQHIMQQQQHNTNDSTAAADYTLSYDHTLDMNNDDNGLY